MKRILFGIGLCLSIFLAPWWLVGIFAFIGACIFPRYYEVVLVGIGMDIIFSSPTIPWYQSFYHTLGSVVILILSMVIYVMIARPKFLDTL